MATTARRRVATTRPPRYQGYGDLPMTVASTAKDNNNNDGVNINNDHQPRKSMNGHYNNNNNGKDEKHDKKKKKQSAADDEKRDCKYYCSRMRVILTLMGINLLVLWMYRSYQNGQNELRFIVSIVKQRMLEKKKISPCFRWWIRCICYCFEWKIFYSWDSCSYGTF